MDFVKGKPAAVKDLIRLVKYWYSKIVRQVPTESHSHLQAFYPLELITIYVWERAESPEVFDLLQGLKEVLTILASKLDDICHFWTVNYDNSRAESGISSMATSWVRWRKQRLVKLGSFTVVDNSVAFCVSPFEPLRSPTADDN